jgi:hypothetical protein
VGIRQTVLQSAVSFNCVLSAACHPNCALKLCLLLFLKSVVRNLQAKFIRFNYFFSNSDVNGHFKLKFVSVVLLGRDFYSSFASVNINVAFSIGQNALFSV